MRLTSIFCGLAVVIIIQTACCFAEDQTVTGTIDTEIVYIGLPNQSHGQCQQEINLEKNC